MTSTPLMGDCRALVLVVDSDREARKRLRSGLEAEGISVVEAVSGPQARALLGEAVAGAVLGLADGDDPDLVVDLTRCRPGAASSAG